MVLTIGASLIATLGLLANNAAVVIGAMVVAPWILPLRALVFGSLIGDRKLLLRAVATLGIGVLLSLVTALTCTRTLLRFLMGYAGLRRPSNFLPQGQLPTKAA